MPATTGIGIVNADHLVRSLGIFAIRENLMGQGQRGPHRFLGWFRLLPETLVRRHFIGPQQDGPQVGHALQQAFFILAVLRAQAKCLGTLFLLSHALGSKRSQGVEQLIPRLCDQTDGRRHGDIGNQVRGILQPQPILDET